MLNLSSKRIPFLTMSIWVINTEKKQFFIEKHLMRHNFFCVKFNASTYKNKIFIERELVIEISYRYVCCSYDYIVFLSISFLFTVVTDVCRLFICLWYFLFGKNLHFSFPFFNLKERMEFLRQYWLQSEGLITLSKELRDKKMSFTGVSPENKSFPRPEVGMAVL